MTMKRGADFRVLLNGTAYAVARINIAGDVQPIVVSNTQGRAGNPAAADAPGFSAVIPDLAEGTVELVSATFDDDENPFEAPYSIALGEYVAVLAYPAGLSGVHYNYGNCLIIHYDHAGNVPGPQPVTIRLRTDAAFTDAAS